MITSCLHVLYQHFIRRWLATTSAAAAPSYQSGDDLECRVVAISSTLCTRLHHATRILGKNHGSVLLVCNPPAFSSHHVKTCVPFELWWLLAFSVKKNQRHKQPRDTTILAAKTHHTCCQNSCKYVKKLEYVHQNFHTNLQEKFQC